MATRKPPNFDQFSFLTPPSSWVAPTELPDLSHETEVAIDTETRDDMLAKDRGPGFYAYERSNPNTGFICGISVAWRDNSIYIPLRHYGEGTCFDHNRIQKWLNDTVSNRRCRFIFHNFGYDWGWISAVFGINPPTNIDDTMAMASMINENLPSFSLDNLCKWQGLPGKDERILVDALKHTKVKEKDTKSYIWRLPAEFVGPYAEQDAVSTLQLAQRLRPLLALENLEVAYQVECDLMPITLRMKQRGIRVDTLRAEEYSGKIFARCNEELADLSESVKQQVTIKHLRQSKWLSEQYSRYGLEPP